MKLANGGEKRYSGVEWLYVSRFRLVLVMCEEVPETTTWKRDMMNCSMLTAWLWYLTTAAVNE